MISSFYHPSETLLQFFQFRRLRDFWSLTVNLCFYVDQIERSIPRLRGRLPFLIWCLGMEAQSWIFLHVRKWELRAETTGTDSTGTETTGTETPAQLKSRRVQFQKPCFHSWMGDSHQYVFQILSMFPGSNWLFWSHHNCIHNVKKRQASERALSSLVLWRFQSAIVGSAVEPSVFATSTHTKTIGNSIKQLIDSADVSTAYVLFLGDATQEMFLLTYHSFIPRPWFKLCFDKNASSFWKNGL